MIDTYDLFVQRLQMHSEHDEFTITRFVSESSSYKNWLLENGYATVIDAFLHYEPSNIVTERLALTERGKQFARFNSL
jgi:hypothetical protein